MVLAGNKKSVKFTVHFTLSGFTLYRFLLRRLPEPEFKNGLLGIAAQQFNGAVMVPHNLAGDGQTNAGAFLLSCIERDEDLLLSRNRNRFAIIGHLHNHVIILAHLGSDVDVLSARPRDLRTFGTSLERSAELIRTIPKDRVAIAESAVRSRADMDMMTAAGAKGFLIGETLMRAEHPGLKLKELLQCC